LLPVVRHGRLAMLDGTTTTFFLLLLFCVVQARQNRWYALGIGICLGLITFTKGMIVLLLGAIACLFLVASRQLMLFKSKYFWVGMLVGNILPLAWYIAQWQHYGNFLQVNFQTQTFNRLVQTVEGHSGPPWYYLTELLKYSFPWLLFLPGGLYVAWKNRHTTWGCLILTGTIIYLGVISGMKTKLPWYIIPVYPFLALAIGVKLSEIWQQEKVKEKIAAVCLALIAMASLVGCGYFAMIDPQPVLIAMSLVVTIDLSMAAWMIRQHNRQFIPILFGGMYLILLMFVSSQSWVWELNEAFAVKPVAQLIQANTPPGTKVYTSFRYGRPSLDFYCDCQVMATNIPTLQKMWLAKSYLLLDGATLRKINLPESKSLGMAEGFTLIAPPTK
jgi:4-amino-4-deoxy-L-arabinose transferase-like glycosyltransferase